MEKQEELDRLSGIRTITIPITGTWRFIKKLFGGNKDEKVNERFSDPIVDRLRDSIRAGNSDKHK